MRLNLGISIVLPINYDIEMPEYSNIIDNNTDFNNMNSLQIMFSKTNLSNEDITNIKKIIHHTKYKHIYVHASYQINIGLEPLITNEHLYNPNLETFITEIKNSIKIGANGIIVHMGKNVKKKYNPDEIYNNMVNFVIQLFNNIQKNKILSKNKDFMILFETPAGQGGEMCVDLNEFVNFIERFNVFKFYKNIGICIDTCHIFQAGYNLNNINEIKKIHKILQPIHNKIKLIHLNDSKNKVGMHLDRHEQIGKGEIEIKKLIKFIMPYIELPMILETIPPYKEQIERLY